MSSEPMDAASPAGSESHEWISGVLVIGGALAAMYGLIIGLDAASNQTAPLLEQIGEVPFGLWNMDFIGNAVAHVVGPFLVACINKFSVLGGLAVGAGYFLQPDKKADQSHIAG